MSRLATAVIGAGPAGLLFCIASRLLGQRNGAEAWPIWLFDKRLKYERTHRLRLAPEPYRELSVDLRDSRFDEIVSFLEQQRFSVEVNRLEERLVGLLADLGITKELAAVGSGPDELSLEGLRRKLETDGRLKPEDPLTIVGADSVHSAVRGLVSQGADPIERTHQHLTRLRVSGPGLPAALGVVEQLKFSKVLASLLDYRLTSGGFAEVDLFLTADEHRALVPLGASPRTPVDLVPGTLRSLSAPFFARIVQRLLEGFGAGACQVSLQSTFKLEHRYLATPVFERPHLKATVFLVGDAAVSLPFQRGMACLASCAQSLAYVHCDLAGLAARTPADMESARAEVSRLFFAPDRPLLYGAHPVPGKILKAEATVYRGKPGWVVLNSAALLTSVHVLHRDANGRWSSGHHLRPTGRSAALADFASRVSPAERYRLEVDAARRREMRVVSARARLVRGAREFVRVSAALPFPMQTWLLSLPDPTVQDGAKDRPTLAFWANLALAAAGAIAALGALLLASRVDARLAWFWLLALPIELAGGTAFAVARSFEGGPQRHTRAVWRLQIVGLFIGGAALAALGVSGGIQILALSTWFLVALPFVAGWYLFEALDRRLWRRSAL